MTTIFEGFISKAGLSGQSIKILVEDYSYTLKEIQSITFRDIYDGEIIKQFIGGKVDTSNVKNRKFIKKRSYSFKSIRYIIEDLSELSNSDWFFIGNKLYYGEKYSFKDQDEVPLIDLEADYIVDRSKLEWHEGIKDLKVLVYGQDDKKRPVIGKKGSGKNIKKETRPDSGKEQVQTEAEKLYKQLTFHGYKGAVKLLLEPVIFQSWLVFLLDNEELRQAYVDAVKFSWSPSGGLRQELFIGLEEKEKKKPKKKGKRSKRRGSRRKKRKNRLGKQT